MATNPKIAANPKLAAEIASNPKLQGLADGTLDPGTPTPGNGYYQVNPISMTAPVGTLEPGRGPAAPTTTPTGQTRDPATAIFRNLLSKWGFSSSDAATLTDWGWQQMLNGASEAEVEDGLYNHPIFKAEYPEYEARQKAGLPVAVQDLLDYRQTLGDVLNRYGLTQFYDGAAIKDLERQLVTNNVSPVEATDRISTAFNEINQAPPEAQSVFGQWFGPNTTQALAAYFLSPDHAMPTLERQVRMAEISGVGGRFGVNVSQARAEDLARLGISSSAALQGFAQLDTMSPLFNETVSEGTDLTKEGVGIDATFGVAPGAQTVLQRRLDERKAALSGTGGASVGNTGIVGL